MKHSSTKALIWMLSGSFWSRVLDHSSIMSHKMRFKITQCNCWRKAFVNKNGSFKHSFERITNWQIIPSTIHHYFTHFALKLMQGSAGADCKLITVRRYISIMYEFQWDITFWLCYRFIPAHTSRLSAFIHMPWKTRSLICGPDNSWILGLIQDFVQPCCAKVR